VNQPAPTVEQAKNATFQNPMVPVVVRVNAVRHDTHDTFTLLLESPRVAQESYSFSPGQFNMLYTFGVGEVPISVSSDPAETGMIAHTIRVVGGVTRSLGGLKAGDSLGLRGPFGSSWPVQAVAGMDVVIVAGGIGLAPLRPVLYQLLRGGDYRRLVLLYGARSPGDLLFTRELEEWGGRDRWQVLTTVDQAPTSWEGRVGLVTALFSEATFDPERTLGMICGPEVMMRFVAREFEKRGVPRDRLYLSLERNMQCALGFCGHCQFGPEFVCLDGPVFRFDRIQHFFNIREA
jgi:NAD(P)H-flavin reductase